jgi:hypothetical protein
MEDDANSPPPWRPSLNRQNAFAPQVVYDIDANGIISKTNDRIKISLLANQIIIREVDKYKLYELNPGIRDVVGSHIDNHRLIKYVTKGEGSDIYSNKYLKYKNKYLTLKKILKL